MSPVTLLNHYEQGKLLHSVEAAHSEIQILYRAVEPEKKRDFPSFWGVRPGRMTPESEIIADHGRASLARMTSTRNPHRRLGIALMAISIGGFLAATWPFLALEATYNISRIKASIAAYQNYDKNAEYVQNSEQVLAAENAFNPLVAPDGSEITPVNRDFSIIIPKIGVNSTIIPSVDPLNIKGYEAALEQGVAHSSRSYFPNENGTTYLFSHSTNYEWFVKDLNAVFYLINKLDKGDLVVIMYLGNRYTYQIRDKQIVGAKEIGYLNPQPGIRSLVLETCWPPGTVAKRLLIFADLVDEKIQGKFTDVGL